ncbi:hypothetical protein [Sulfuricurvum sp.]|uniref:hypothetical protein n=1 Tax=Sulfuricurvum sp. TaxID=2025608 RepID=UPI003BB1E3CA
MSDVRLVNAPITLVYDEALHDLEHYEREFHQMSESDEDPIGQWLKLAKARGETSESDPVMLNLMVELYRKMDKLEQILTMSAPTRLSLINEAMIESIGFDHFKLTEEVLEPGKRYYGRVEMPIHPKRDIAIFFEAVDSSLAKITQMHDRDEREWASYLTARERVMIRQLKGRE